jgi:hypothetical protein
LCRRCPQPSRSWHPLLPLASAPNGRPQRRFSRARRLSREAHSGDTVC